MIEKGKEDWKILKGWFSRVIITGVSKFNTAWISDCHTIPNKQFPDWESAERLPLGCCLCCYTVAQLCLTFATSWTVAHQAPLSVGIPRQEYWSRLSFPSPGYLPGPGIELTSPALQADSSPLSHQGSPASGYVPLRPAGTWTPCFHWPVYSSLVVSHLILPSPWRTLFSHWPSYMFPDL